MLLRLFATPKLAVAIACFVCLVNVPSPPAVLLALCCISLSFSQFAVRSWMITSPCERSSDGKLSCKIATMDETIVMIWERFSSSFED